MHYYCFCCSSLDETGKAVYVHFYRDYHFLLFFFTKKLEAVSSVVGALFTLKGCVGEAMKMRRSSVRHLGMFLGGVTFVVVSIGVTLNEVKRYQLIKKYENTLSVAQTDLARIMTLGGGQKPEEIVRGQQEALAAAQEVADLKNRWNVLSVAQNDGYHEKIERLIKINKDLIATYEQEVAHLMLQGEHEKSERMLFVHEKIVQANMNIIMLQRKLLNAGDEKNNLIRQKTQRLVAVHQESIQAYEQEIREYQKLGVTEHDPKIHFAREQIAQKRHEIAQLEASHGLHSAS